MTDCLEQVRNDVKVTKEKLSALNTNSKSTQPKTKENEIVKHDNAEKSKKRKEKRVSNRTWDTVVMVMNEKAYLEVVELRENSVKLSTTPLSRHGVFAKCNAEGKLQWLAEIKESWPICKICRETCGQSSGQNERENQIFQKLR